MVVKFILDWIDLAKEICSYNLCTWPILSVSKLLIHIKYQYCMSFISNTVFKFKIIVFFFFSRVVCTSFKSSIRMLYLASVCCSWSSSSACLSRGRSVSIASMTVSKRWSATTRLSGGSSAGSASLRLSALWVPILLKFYFMYSYIVCSIL